MIHHNNPHAHEAIVPDDKNVLGSFGIPREPHLRDGLYTRSDIDVGGDEVEQRLLDHSGRGSILDYQVWAEGNWKTRHGTFDSVERFTAKLEEEQREVLQAIRLQGADPLDNYDDITSELGDILWCTSALASNGGADISTGMKNRLFRYVAGTQWIVKGIPTPPPWRDSAAQLATKYEPIDLIEIDQLVEAGFEPSISQVINIYDPKGDEEDVWGHLNSLGSIILGAQMLAHRQYGRNMNAEENELATIDHFKTNTHQLGELAASCFLEIAFVANRATGSTVTQIVAENVLKISQRVEKGQVDKTDGPR